MMWCKWEQTYEGQWETACGECFEITSGTPEENSMKWCCYCGKKLKQVLYKEPKE